MTTMKNTPHMHRGGAPVYSQCTTVSVNSCSALWYDGANALVSRRDDVPLELHTHVRTAGSRAYHRRRSQPVPYLCDVVRGGQAQG